MPSLINKVNPQCALDVGVPEDARSRSGELCWPLLALIAVALVTAVSVVWNHEHRFAFNWDESDYVNEMQTDIGQFNTHGFSGVIKAWLGEDILRPPAYRVLAFPFAVLFGPSPFTLRMVAIVFRIATLWLLFAGVRNISSRKTAALAVILLALCPDFIFFGAVFYNEYALYLAVAGVLYFVFRSWNQPMGSAVNCVGLGVFLGLGALAKASFFGMAGSFLLIVACLGLRKQIIGPTPQFLLNACVVGAVIAAPWWLLNFHSAVHFVLRALQLVQNSIGPSDLNSRFQFGFSFLRQGVGLPMGCLCVAILFVTLARHLCARSTVVSKPETLAWCSVLFAPMPICVLAFIELDVCLYHISQSLIFFAAGFALLAQSERWLDSPFRLCVLSLAIFLQLAMIFTPVMLRREYAGELSAWTVAGLREQWDWNKFRVLLRTQGLKEPSIAYLGFQNVLNQQQIIYPWLSHHEQPPSVTWLWRASNGSPSIAALIAAARTNDVTFTISNLATADWSFTKSDNAYNAAFANRMCKSPDFQAPLHLTLGRLHPVDVMVFIRKAQEGPLKSAHGLSK